MAAGAGSGDVVSLVRTEVVKQTRRVRTWVVFGLMVAIPAIITLALWANPPERPGGGEGPGGGFFFLATRSGLLLPAAVLLVASRFLLIGVAALFGGDTIAAEASWGNLRSMLVRPVKRGRLVVVKLGAATVLTGLSTLLIVVTALIAGVIVYGWHGIGGFQLGFGILGVPAQSPGTVLWHLVIATTYVTWSLAAAVAFGFMVSTMTDSPIGAAAAAFGLYVVSAILDAVDAIGSIRNGFPTHYSDAWQDLFLRNHANADMVRGAIVQLGYVAVFLAVGAWWFRRKDVMS